MSASSLFRHSTKVRWIVTHSRPHEDEIVGIALLGMSEAFDSSRAQVVTVKGDAELASYEHARDAIFIGVGANLEGVDSSRVFDEHASDADGRRNRCAADIVAQATNIARGTSLDSLLTEVRDHDLRARSTPTSFATVIKGLYESKPEAEVIEWAMRGAKALCAHAIKPRQLGSHEDLFVQISSTIFARVGKESGFAAQELGRIIPHISASSRSKDITDISTIFSVLMEEGERDAKDWLKTAIDGLALKQVLFLKSVDEFVRKHASLAIPVDPMRGKGAPGSLRVAFVTSDSGLMDKVFRSKAAGEYDLMVLKNSSGGLCVFTNNRNQGEGRFNLDALVRMIRWAEVSASERRPSDWDSLNRDGDHPATPEWFYFKKGGSLMNGSKSKPSVPKSRLTWADMRYILSLAFTRRGVEQFIVENNVRA